MLPLQVSGFSSLDGLDLTGDFDPETWDKQMAAIFSSEYYSQPDEALRAEMEEDETWGGGDTEGEGGDAGEGDGDTEGASWGAAGEAKGAESAAKRERGGRRAKRSLEAAAAAASGGGSSSELARTAQQALDEYYGLDYEDVIGEGESALATRFKYRQVEPAGYGVRDANTTHHPFCPSLSHASFERAPGLPQWPGLGGFSRPPALCTGATAEATRARPAQPVHTGCAWLPRARATIPLSPNRTRTTIPSTPKTEQARHSLLPNKSARDNPRHSQSRSGVTGLDFPNRSARRRISSSLNGAE